MSGSFDLPDYEPERPGAETLWAGYHHPGVVSSEPGIHVHPGLEFGLTLSGEARLQYGSFVLECNPGDVWLCGMWEPHVRLAPIGDAVDVVLIFRPEFLGEEPLGSFPWLTLFAVSPDQRPRVISPEARRTFRTVGEMLLREVRAQSPHWRVIVRLELLRLLTELMREWDRSGAEAVPYHAHVADLARLMPAINLVHSDPPLRAKVSDAAARCNLSASRFRALFRKTIGMSFSDWYMRARLGLAARWLLHSRRSVAAIADQAGFTDASHLDRCFARHYGCTPTQYRHRMNDTR